MSDFIEKILSPSLGRGIDQEKLRMAIAEKDENVEVCRECGEPLGKIHIFGFDIRFRCMNCFTP